MRQLKLLFWYTASFNHDSSSTPLLIYRSFKAMNLSFMFADSLCDIWSVIPLNTRVNINCDLTAWKSNYNEVRWATGSTGLRASGTLCQTISEGGRDEETSHQNDATFMTSYSFKCIYLYLDITAIFSIMKSHFWPARKLITFSYSCGPLIFVLLYKQAKNKWSQIFPQIQTSSSTFLPCMQQILKMHYTLWSKY